MLDIKFIRDNPGIVKESLKRRNQKEKIKWVDEILKGYNELNSLKQEVDDLRHKRNILSNEVNLFKKQGKNIKDKLEEVKNIPEDIRRLDESYEKLKDNINSKLIEIPNIIHKEVPDGIKAEDNKVVRVVGKIKKEKFELKNHAELIESLKLGDFDAGRDVSGQGFNYLTGDLALLDNALQRYGVDLLLKKGFKLVMPPMLLKKDILLGALNGLKDFENVVYKIDNEDLYLIGTAEHSLVTMLKDNIVEEKNLPLKFCAVTPCFRKEIGAHGVDTKGLFRMHQFNKVEQVVFCKPEESDEWLEKMLKTAEEMFKSLKIPYRVIELCAGDLGNKFSRQYDIEAWFPRQKEYKEVTSTGNCTDFQARALNVRFIKGQEKKFLYILNSTMVATSRAMVAILENFQQKDGTIEIPKELQKYMNGKKIIGK